MPFSLQKAVQFFYASLIEHARIFCNGPNTYFDFNHMKPNMVQPDPVVTPTFLKWDFPVMPSSLKLSFGKGALQNGDVSKSTVSHILKFQNVGFNTFLTL